MSTPSGPTGPTDPAGTPESTGATERADVSGAPDPVQPTDPTAPTAAYDAPTAAYDAPTAAYDQAPPVPPAPAAAPYGQPPQAAYGQAPYGQAPYGQAPSPQAAYGQPPVAPSGPDARPKTLARVSLILAIVGTLLAGVGFIPLGWGGLIAVFVGGLLLLAGFVLSIVALASRKHGGTPLGIAALIVSVLGAVVWSIALIVSFVFGVIATADRSADAAPVPSASAPADDSDEPLPGSGVSEADESAFLAEARPQLAELFAEIDPNFTDDMLSQVFPDEALVGLGQSFAQAGEGSRQLLVDTLVSNLDGLLDADSAARFVDILTDAAEDHLQ